MKRVLAASIAGSVAFAAASALAAPPPGNAAPVLIDFESCSVGANCVPQPLDYVGAGGVGEVVDLGGNKAFQLQTYAYYWDPNITEARFGWDGTTHVPFDVIGSHGPRIVPFDFSPAALTFDLFMPNGGYVLVDFRPSAIQKYLVLPGVWTTFALGDRTPYGGEITVRGGDAYIDNLSYGRLQAAVPEPSTWALIILGFGFAGASLRARRIGTSTKYESTSKTGTHTTS